MGKLLISRRAGADGKLRNTERLALSFTDASGTMVFSSHNACSWEDFLFHLGPVTPRMLLHEADRGLRRAGSAALAVNDSVVDEAWIKSFLLTSD